MLVLRDVLGFRAAEVAGDARHRRGRGQGRPAARPSTLRTRLPAADRERPRGRTPPASETLVGRFADAVERGDVDAVVALLTGDARLTMPPLPLEYQGREAIGAFLRERRGRARRAAAPRADAGQRPARVRPPTCTARDRPRGLFVLTLEDDAVAGITWFSDTELFRRFGLPPALSRE